MGGCDTESFEDMDEENVKNYLIEQLVPIVAIVDGENYEEISKQLVEENAMHVVDMLNNSKLAYESILEMKKKISV